MSDSNRHELWRKIAEMYAETDAKIMRELSCDIVMTVLRDVQRIRLEAFEKMLFEARAERSSSGETLN
jgi:hypothetical protein